MQNCNCDRCDRIAEPCWNPCSSRISVLRRSRLCGKRVAIRAAECWSRRSREDQNRGKQKVARETRTSYDRPGCIHGAIPRRCRSIPTPSPPTDRPVYHRFRIYPGISRLLRARLVSMTCYRTRDGLEPIANKQLWIEQK